MAGPLRNPRWERFAREYAAGETLESAYRRAFDKSGKYAKFNASRLSHKPAVRARINELMEQFAEASAIKLEYLQHQVLQTLRANPQDLFDESGQPLEIQNLPREVAAAIKTLRFDKKTGRVAEIVLADKMAAAGVLLRSIIGPDVAVNNTLHLNDLGRRLDEAVRRTARDAPALPKPVRELPPEPLRSSTINKADLPMEV